MDFSTNNEKENVIRFMKIDEFNLFMPRNTIRESIRKDAEKHLRQKFDPGIYRGSVSNEIAQHMFKFYDTRLDKKIKKISKAYFIYFALFQYDIAAKIQSLSKSGGLTQESRVYWLSNGPLYRRTVGYLIDKMIGQINAPFNNNIQSIENHLIFDECFIYSENALKYSIISNEIHYLNDSYKIKIHPSNSQYFLESLPTPKSTEYTLKHNYYVDQTTKDNFLRTKYIKEKPFERNWELHGNVLNSAFEHVFGLTYFQIMFRVTDMIINTRDITSINKIPLIYKKQFINKVAKQFKVDKKKIEIFFEGLILRKEHFQKNVRTVWKYKQPYRINKRPFLELKNGNTVYLTWSNEMLKERLDQLDNDFVFKTLPPEWKHNLILKSSNSLSNQAGIWFEKLVKTNLNHLGIVGDKIKDKIVKTSTNCNAKMVGGFDFLGYCPTSNMLIIIECKYMDSGFEPVSYHDDISAFNNMKQGYLTKLDMKVNWVVENFYDLKDELSTRLSYQIPKSCHTIGVSFFTYVLTFAYAFLEKYPCVSFTEFISKYEQENRWYLEKGIFHLKSAQLPKIKDAEN